MLKSGLTFQKYKWIESSIVQAIEVKRFVILLPVLPEINKPCKIWHGFVYVFAQFRNTRLGERWHVLVWICYVSNAE